MVEIPNLAAYGRIDPSFIECDDTTIAVTETDHDGQGRGPGTLTLTVTTPCIRIRLPRQTPAKWLKEKKCADSVVFEFVPDGVNLHIVELKSKVGPQEWLKCKQQFCGALHNALAINGVLELSEFRLIRLHLAYTTDTISPQTTAAPSTLKLGLGNRVPGVADWIARRVDLDSWTAVPLSLILRDGQGNASATLG
jgi:hypothetical protein